MLLQGPRPESSFGQLSSTSGTPRCDESTFKVHDPAEPRFVNRCKGVLVKKRVIAQVAALSTHVEMRVPLVPFGPQAGSSVVLVTPDMPDGSPEVAEKGPLISGWGSSIVPVTCLYDAFVDVGPTKSKLCLSFLPVAAPKTHDIPLAINCE
jgi:hypothetical protein